MSLPATNPSPAQTSFEELPDALKEMLRDEANLSTARSILEDARNDVRTREDDLRASQPKISFFTSRKVRQKIAADNAVIQNQIATIDAMLARVNTCRERLQGPLRALLLQHLEQIDPLYRQGLRASRFHEHWRRGHSIITDRLLGFLRDLKTARLTHSDDISRGLGVHSEESNWAIKNLLTASTSLDFEIEKMNRASTEHTASVQGTQFARIHLPVLEQWSCVARTETLFHANPRDALTIVDATISEFIEYRQPSLVTLSGMFQAAADEHCQIAETRLRSRWSQLLNYAECHLVTDAALEPTLTAIEQRIASSERSRRTAQIPFTPFSTER